MKLAVWQERGLGCYGYKEQKIMSAMCALLSQEEILAIWDLAMQSTQTEIDAGERLGVSAPVADMAKGILIDLKRERDLLALDYDQCNKLEEERLAVKREVEVTKEKFE